MAATSNAAERYCSTPYSEVPTKEAPIDKNSSVVSSTSRSSESGSGSSKMSAMLFSYSAVVSRRMDAGAASKPSGGGGSSGSTPSSPDSDGSSPSAWSKSDTPE